MNQAISRGHGRKRARRYAIPERSLAAAAGWSVLVVLAVAIAIVTAEISIPGTALRDWWLLVNVNGQVSPTSELYQRLWADITREEALFVTPFSLLTGGIAFGRLAPTRAARIRTFTLSGGIALGVLLVCVAVRWGIILWAQYGHLRTGELSAALLLTQFACIVGWMIAFLLGTLLGVLWRGAAVRRRGAPPPPTESLSASSR